MHINNQHNKAYNFKLLCVKHSKLIKYVFTNEYNSQTIDFSDSNAVFHLNKAILKTYYNIDFWEIPKGYLCPPIPSRVDYIHYLNDLLENKTNCKGLDIGVGANCIYSLLGASVYNWKMIGTDISKIAVEYAQKNVFRNDSIKDLVEIRHQENNANIFKDIIQPNEFYDFTLVQSSIF